MKLRNKFIVAIDTRERRPYSFVRSEIKTLKTGDYSVIGLEDKITIERKSKIDAYSTIGANRRRFERELNRMTGYAYSAIVIESSLADFVIPPSFTEMSPRAAIGSLVSWSIKYNIHVFWASDYLHGNALTYQLLEKFWKYNSSENVK